MQLKKKKIPFWQETSHLFGCYGAIIFCCLSLANIYFDGWFWASFWGYILGRIFYWGCSYFIEETIEVTESPPLEQVQISEMQSNNNPKVINTEKAPKALTVFAQFSILKHQIQPLLPIESNEKIQEIHALLTVLNRKLNNSKDIETRRAIHKIQRVINNYLTPTLTHYQTLPVMFHDRKIDQGNTPNQLILQQLNLVHEELLQITEHVFANDLNVLIEHGLFLEQKLKPAQYFKVGSSLENNH